MKLIRSIYEDKTGRTWEVEQLKLPRPDGRRGYYTGWSIQSGKYSNRGKNKKELLEWAESVVSGI
jgi:hypothetical protein